MVLPWHLPYKATQMSYLGLPHREGSGQETKTLYADTWMPLLPPSQPSHPQLRSGIGPRHLIQSHGHCPAPLLWGHLDWGCCQSPFHHLLLTVGTTAFHGQILLHTEVQNSADETASTASQSLTTGFLLPQTWHPYSICLPKYSSDNTYSCRNT